MLKLHLLLAASPTLDLPQGPQSSRILGLALKDFLLLGGVLLAIALLLFFWAYWSRRDPRKRAETGGRVLYRSDARAEGAVKKRRKRGRHPDNLPRNPTLAQAGGLPPIRDEPG